jgi:hypothetical protein
MAVEASSIAEPASILRLEIVKPDMIELRPLRDPIGATTPLGCRRTRRHLAVAIMSLAEGFARDGIGASSLGFEIFVRWTSLEARAQFTYLVGPDLTNGRRMPTW